MQSASAADSCAASSACAPAAVASADVQSKAQGRFYALLVFMGFFWLLIALLGHHAAPLDVIEMHTWAQAPQIGYYKHPPLPAWGIWLSESLFGHTHFALFLPSALSIVLSLLCVWPLALACLGPRRALLAMFLQSLLAYYNLYAPDFNHNVAQMPVWAAAIGALYAALHSRSLWWWAAFGLALGLSGLSKYSAVFLLAAMLLYLGWDSAARARLNWGGVLLAAALALAVVGPHLYWLYLNDLAPLHYAQERLQEMTQHSGWGKNIVSYIGMQVAVHIALWAVLLWAWVRSANGLQAQLQPARENALSHSRFLLALGLGPFALTLALGASGSYLHPMWASAMFPLSGIITVWWLGAAADQLASRRAFLLWLSVMLLFGAVYACKGSIWWTQLTGKYTRAAYPGPELARELDARWRQAHPGKPLKYIIGTPWEAGVASFYSSYAPQIVIDADLRISPWVTAQDIYRCGAITVAVQGTDLVAEIEDIWPEIEEFPPFRLRPARPGSFPELGMAWAILPPHGECK
ncbi:glycosyltransferase family 39 protein [Massilia sp. W12]|uniref:glycosyltransferase family 39 protein n=1 Tax=Massilia sp. W12 TaxID=3126507 RepID=UPI0030CC05C8